MTRFGILGCGRIGHVHARSIMALPSAKVAAVADFVDAAAKDLAEKCGAEVQSAEDVIANPNVDAVIIGTPTDTHFDLIHACARAGKAIFCEKPVDMSADNIRNCMDVVAETGVPFMVGFNRRFDGNFSHVQKQIADGSIGPVEIVTIQSRDPGPPPISYIKSSGGIFRDMMIHDFDMARFLLGEEPVTLFAVGSSLVDPEIGKAGDVDTAAVTLSTACGKICQISNSRRATYGYDQRIEVHCAGGMLRAANVLENTVEVATDAGFQTAPAQHFFLERYEAAFATELKTFIENLENGSAMSPSIKDGLRAQMLADAASESLATGRAVQISPD